MAMTTAAMQLRWWGPLPATHSEGIARNSNLDTNEAKYRAPSETNNRTIHFPWSVRKNRATTSAAIARKNSGTHSGTNSGTNDFAWDVRQNCVLLCHCKKIIIFSFLYKQETATPISQDVPRKIVCPTICPAICPAICLAIAALCVAREFCRTFHAKSFVPLFVLLFSRSKRHPSEIVWLKISNVENKHMRKELLEAKKTQK